MCVSCYPRCRWRGRVERARGESEARKRERVCHSVCVDECERNARALRVSCSAKLGGAAAWSVTGPRGPNGTAASSSRAFCLRREAANSQMQEEERAAVFRCLAEAGRGKIYTRQIRYVQGRQRSKQNRVRNVRRWV